MTREGRLADIFSSFLVLVNVFHMDVITVNSTRKQANSPTVKNRGCFHRRDITWMYYIHGLSWFL